MYIIGQLSLVCYVSHTCRIVPQETRGLTPPSRTLTRQFPLQLPHQQNRTTSTPDSLPSPALLPPSSPQNTLTTPTHSSAAITHSKKPRWTSYPHRVPEYPQEIAKYRPHRTRKAERRRKRHAVTMWTLPFSDQRMRVKAAVVDHHQGLPPCITGREGQAIPVTQSTVSLQRLHQAMCTRL